MDDDPLVLGGLRRIVPRVVPGLAVVGAASGNQAIALLTDDGAFDMVLSDLSMSDGSAVDLHRWLRVRLPRLAERMVVMTGGALSAEHTTFLTELAARVLQKPIRSNHLRAKLEEVMEHANEADRGD